MINKSGTGNTASNGVRYGFMGKPEQKNHLEAEDRVNLNQGLTPEELKQAEAINRVGRPLPKQGWIEGTFNKSPLKLTFDRRNWTIDGTSENKTVKLNIDHDNSTIKGEAGGKKIDLGFDWSPEKISIKENSGRQVRMDIDWKKGRMKGRIDGNGVNLQFDPKKGFVKGVAAGNEVDLGYDLISGRLDGRCAGKPMDVNLTNIDMYDFINHFYVFV